MTLQPAGAPARTAPKTAPAPAAPAAAREQAQTVLQAQSMERPARGGAVDWMRSHPVVMISTVAGIFAAGFGVYVYLQIFHPGFFIGQSSIVAKAPPVALKPPPVLAPSGATAPAEPISSESVLKEAAAESAASAAARPQPALPTPQPEETGVGRSNTVVVSSGNAEVVLNPLNEQAYAAMRAGDMAKAQNLYGQLLQAEPRNIDALLGIAVTAAQQGNTEEATRRYLQILELEPRHALAQNGLIALLGRADPVAAESRLKQLIAREPSAYLHFTLGNLYADQSLWAQAQQSYFQAHQLEPSNPDYAYNLAVGLEHLSQPKLALDFYRRAAQLAATRGRANFNVALVQERIGRLAQQVE